MPRLGFFGATQTVTGSKYLLQTARGTLQVDCGLFQGLKELRLRNWDPLPYDPADVTALVLTHAHIDHTGYLPRLVKAGFRGPIYCTPATADLTELLLFDSAKNQEDDAEYANRRGFSKHHPALPLYDARDVPPVLRRLRTVEREKPFEPVPEMLLTFHDAGHLLGSTMIEAVLHEQHDPVRVLFSGDVGRYGAPLYHDPRPPCPCDYLVCESTYGDREHGEEPVQDELAGVILDNVRRGGVLLFPAFAVGRAQQLIYLLQLLIAAGRIPELSIYVDSPMAVTATNIYAEFVGEHDLSEAQLAPHSVALNGRNVHLVRTAAESKQLNKLAGPAIIISSSGMLTGGRVLHHLRQRLPQPENTIVLGGFMAAGTRGRALLEGAKSLKMHGQYIPVRAAVRSISGLSGHAGRSELLRWLSGLDAPRRVFLTHGELSSAQALAETLRASRGWQVEIPQYGQWAELQVRP